MQLDEKKNEKKSVFFYMINHFEKSNQKYSEFMKRICIKCNNDIFSEDVCGYQIEYLHFGMCFFCDFISFFVANAY